MGWYRPLQGAQHFEKSFAPLISVFERSRNALYGNFSRHGL